MLNYVLTKNPKKSNDNAPQIFDLLQLSKKEKECHALCISLIENFANWKKNQSIQKPILFYNHFEGHFLRRAAHGAVLNYRLARAKRIRLFTNYIESLPVSVAQGGER